MNRILYFLIGGCVAGATALAFFQKLDIARISSTDVVATTVFVSALAAATCILLYSRWGRRLRSRLQQNAVDEDERVRSNARTKGEVRTPPIGPVP
jgi:branched-subunit amino acid ABC-type transport system permease component